MGLTHLALLAGVEFLGFLLATLNLRFCAKGHIARTLFTDVLISLNGFFLIRLVAEAQSMTDVVGYMTGAALGSYVGMRLTRGLEER